ncbi:MAG TPA: hypothetical protein PKZ84_04985 [Anaerolineae bacterium]|nr:hypothetical protein [Anaerolineae bacterium]HQI83793.1 hypothetical protein [Anaerolineae bacterium]
MEFLNIGGGELIIIVLLAIILFGPEDILKIMRTVGGYVRKIQQMWTQMSSGLKGEFIDDDIIPAEIQETIKETRDSVAEVQKTLAEVQASAKADLNDTLTAVAEIKASAEADIKETQATVSEIEMALEDAKSSVETSLGEIPKAVQTITTTSTAQAISNLAKDETVPTDVKTSEQIVQPSPATALVETTQSVPDGEIDRTAEATIPDKDI